MEHVAPRAGPSAVHPHRPGRADSAGLAKLGEALSARVGDVLALQQRRMGKPLEGTADGARAAIWHLAQWLTGEPANDEGVHDLISAGASQVASGLLELREATKLSLAWRDAVISVLDEEAAALRIDAITLEEARQAVRASHDAYSVRLAERFDQMRAELQARVDAQHAELRLRATKDALTGVANRHALLDELEHGLEDARAARRRLAVVFLDLDRFKAVNDRLGHVCGDVVLAEVGRRLAACTRPRDVLGRIGGDEFVIVCRDLDPTDADRAATAIAERARCALREGFTWNGELLEVTASIGVAVSDDRSTSDSLLAAADAAMYRAKGTASGRIEVTPAS